jgi:hypothetical protein
LQANLLFDVAVVDPMLVRRALARLIIHPAGHHDITEHG